MGGNNDEKNQQHAKEAPPPLHSVAFVGLMTAVSVATLPSLESIDEIAVLETFTRRVFPDLISLSTLAWLRTVCGILMITLQIYTVFFGEGWEQSSNYLPQTKLQKATIQMHGIRTMLPFTSWSWNVLALSFLLNGIIALSALYKEHDVVINIWMLRIAVILFEISAPMTLLVALVVRYAIWPRLLQASVDTSELSNIRTLLWHNANVILALSEVGLLGGLPIRLGDFSVAPLFGISYVIFTWCMIYRWNPQKGAQFIYFFFDTTLGKTTTIVLLVLLVALTFFYGLFAMADDAFQHLGGGPLTHALAVLVVCSCVCRFRD